MNKTSLIYISGIALISLLAGGCNGNEPSFNPGEGAEGPYISITLRIPFDAETDATRSFPTGGHDGDGREQGLANENSLADANLFFFIGSGFNQGTPDPGQTEVAGVYVADLSTYTPESEENPFEKKITIKVPTSGTHLEEKGILTAPEVGFIAVVNAGTDLSSEISDLNTLREYSSFSASWRYSAETGYKDFLMTTAYDAETDGYIDIDGTTRYVGSNRLRKMTATTDNPTTEWSGEATVQRLCARVDLMYKSQNIGDKELVFATSGGNKVHVTNILPVNFMRKPSYLLTKVTSGIPDEWNETSLGTITWAGVEKKATGGDLPANYVIEPYTLAKAAGSNDLSSWYGESQASNVTTHITDPGKGAVYSYPTADIAQTQNRNFEKVTIIGYPNENIQAPTCYNSYYITGLAIRATFQPGKICRKTGDSYESVTLTDASWHAMTDKTIWRYQPTTGVTGVRENDAIYFTDEADAEAYRESHASNLATITKYEGGVCYYNLWLRHYNDESYLTEGSLPKSSYPMEYAIVRNNIYRISLSFSGPGEPVPTLREPDTMMSRIFVRKWNLRKENNPMQF